MTASLLLSLLLFLAPAAVAGWQLVDELCDTAGARRVLPADWCDAAVPRCRWTNITCDGNNQLWKLDLYNVPLDAPLPDTIDAPGPYVHTLRLVNCGLSGPVPHTLNSVTTLRVLDLSNNALSGDWPAWQLVAGHLEQFNIANNRLGGLTMFNSLTFPNQWRNMTHFNIANNSFVEDWQLVSEPYWPKIVYFNIENNRFCGTPPALRRVIQYRIGGNYFVEIERVLDVPPPAVLNARYAFVDCDMSRVPFRPAPPVWLGPELVSRCRYRYDPSNRIYTVGDLTTRAPTTSKSATLTPATSTDATRIAGAATSESSQAATAVATTEAMTNGPPSGAATMSVQQSVKVATLVTADAASMRVVSAVVFCSLLALY
jgi:hypothetical protein